MEKLIQIREKLEENQLDAILITSPINRRYVTGFTGTAGAAIVTANEALFITDFRYIEQATEQAKDFTIIQHKQKMIQELHNQLEKLSVKRVGFEKDHTTFTEYEQYQRTFSKELIPVSGILEDLRLVKSASELSIMKQAAKIVDDAFTHIQRYLEPGVKEMEIANELEFFMRRQGATSSSFDTIVASGYRGALPHGVASEKEIQNGELVTMDYGALFQGYCSDTTRTVAVGNISDDLRKIYDTVLAAQLKGLEEVQPGITGKEADTIVRDYIDSKGYGEYFGHSTGHGLGMEVHEQPSLAQSSETVLKPGMVVTVEPGIYIPDLGGCRIEDDLLITESGNERLTFAEKELVQL